MKVLHLFCYKYYYRIMKYYLKQTLIVNFGNKLGSICGVFLSCYPKIAINVNLKLAQI